MPVLRINQSLSRAFALVVVSGLLILFNITAYSQVTFNKHFDNDSSLDAAACIFQTADNGYVIAGNYYFPMLGLDGSFIIRTDCNGDTIWKKAYDMSSTGGDCFENGFELSDGNFILCGYLQDSIQNRPNAFLSKINKKGEILWTNEYGDSLNEIAKMVKRTTDNGFILVGGTTSNSNGGYDVYLIKTDSNGNLQWQQHYGGASDDVGYSIDFAKDGGYILGGRTNSYGLGGVDLYMIKVDNAGNFQWQKTFGTTGDDYAETVISTLDSGYVMVGGIADAYGSYDSYIVKTDNLGNKTWDNVYGKTPNNEGIKYVVQLQDSSFTLSGSIYLDNTWKWQAWLLKTNKYGDSLWCKTYGNSGVSDYIYEMCKTSDGGYALAGQYNRIGPPYQDMWLIKTDSLGCDSSICNFGCNACAYIQPRIWVLSDTIFWPNKTFAFYDSSDFAQNWFWDFGDGTFDTVQNPVHTYDTTGTYIVKLIAYYGNCSDSVVMDVYVVNTTNINNNKQEPHYFKIYPNPATNKVYIDPGESGKEYTVELLNLTGTLLQRKKVPEIAEMDVSRLPDGLYIIRYIGKEKAETKKLMIINNGNP